MHNRINKILEEIHPYKIYNNSKSVKGQWATYVPDPTKPSGRRAMKRNSLEALQTAIVKYYKRSSHLDMQLQAFFAKWVIFRRDETAVKPATIRRDMSLWRTHIKDIVIDEIQNIVRNGDFSGIIGLILTFDIAIKGTKTLTLSLFSKLCPLFESL